MNRRITIDPQVTFGLPAISGIRRESLAELADAGDSVREIAAYGRLGTLADVRAAVQFERGMCAAP